MQQNGDPHIGPGVGDLPHEIGAPNVPQAAEALLLFLRLAQLRQPLLPAFDFGSRVNGQFV